MAKTGPYEEQLREACQLVADAVPHSPWQLAFQSRSGPPTQAWLEPSVESVVRTIAAKGDVAEVVVAPIGFLYEHVEIIYDLDVELDELCDSLHLTMYRASTPGLHPRFVKMIRELILERTAVGSPRLAMGPQGPPPDGPSPLECRPGCCTSGAG